MLNAQRLGALYGTVMCAVVAAVPALAQLLPEPKDVQFLPLLTARSGVYAVAGSGIMGGFIDYLTLLNTRDGGIDGLKLVWEECETASTTDRAVDCYERLKTKGL
jgi:branched-chain amino acid transport system substrate-binding protein